MDEALDAGMDAIRRTVGEMMDMKLESVMRRLAAIRAAAATPDATAVSLVDDLMADLGALKFDAGRLDFMDPLIHSIVEERSIAEAPDGVIVECLRPGFRTARGVVILKACVAVNRRRT
jgi:hypothetical protein